MNNVTSKKKTLNSQQTTLREIMTSHDQHELAIRMFLDLHAHYHSGKVLMSEGNLTNIWSYEDAILDDLKEDQIKKIPKNIDHSIAWIVWHMARIEDIAMNILVAGTQQIFTKDRWMDRLNIKNRDSGNEMEITNVKIFSDQVNVNELRSYRVAVGCKTREVVRHLTPTQLKEKVDPKRIQQVKDQGALVEAAHVIAKYWSRRNIAGLLLMPATRHNLVHLNEAYRLKQILI